MHGEVEDWDLMRPSGRQDRDAGKAQRSSNIIKGQDRRKKGSKLSRLPKQHDTTRAQPDHDSVQINSALKIKYFRLGVTRTEAQTTKPSKPLLCLHLMIQNDVSCELHFHCTFSSKLINGKDKFTQVDDEVFSLLLQLYWNRPSPHQQDALLVFGNEWIQQLMMSHKVEVRLEGYLPHFDATSNPMVYM